MAFSYKIRIKDETASDLIKKMLQLNPSMRLGMLSGGEKDITNHPLCAGVNMDALLKKELKPPWVPKLANANDTSNFDDFGTPSTGKKFDKYIDEKYNDTWEKEFGDHSN